MVQYVLTDMTCVLVVSGSAGVLRGLMLSFPRHGHKATRNQVQIVRKTDDGQDLTLRMSISEIISLYLVPVRTVPIPSVGGMASCGWRFTGYHQGLL